MRIGKRLAKKIFWELTKQSRANNVIGKTKYFCIGRNKTGTSSLAKAFSDLGFVVGDQSVAESLTDRYYFRGQFGPIIDYCRTAEVFQDIPFSYPGTYRYLDAAFPESKFILSVRDDAEQWYKSITRYHAIKFGGGEIPTAEVLRSSTYVRKGFMANVMRVHGTCDKDPYNKDKMMNHYEHYNRAVIQYFQERSNDLLVLNLAEQGSYQRFLDFLGLTSSLSDFPWENRT